MLNFFYKPPREKTKLTNKETDLTEEEINAHVDKLKSEQETAFKVFQDEAGDKERVKEVIKILNTKVFKENVKLILRRCGAESNDTRTNIFFKYDESKDSTYMNFDYYSNSIILNLCKIRTSLDQLHSIGKSESFLYKEIIYAIFHEFTHRIGFVKNKLKPASKIRRLFRSKTELHVGVMKYEGGKMLFNSLNEGLTDLLSLKLQYDTLKSLGLWTNSFSFDEYLNFNVSGFLDGSRDNYVGIDIIVIDTIKRVQKYLKLPIDVIKKAFIHAYVYGDVLYKKEVRKMLEQSCDKEYIEDLENLFTFNNLAHLTKDTKEFCSRYEIPLDQNSILERIREFIDFEL